MYYVHCVYSVTETVMVMFLSDATCVHICHHDEQGVPTLLDVLRIHPESVDIIEHCLTALHNISELGNSLCKL